MDTMTAWAKGAAARGKRARVFDWERAADRIRETRPPVARAGLRDDWEWTGGPIWLADAPIPEEDTYTYLASTWAIPELALDDRREECWRWVDETPGWDAHTYWPETAIQRLAST